MSTFLPNNWEEIVIRLVLAVVLSGLIGIERLKTNHDAGLRTHILVCLGSAGIMLMSEVMQQQFGNDIGRIPAQIVSGIGFLGAGCIIVNNNRIKGLTTAAGLWTTACVGLCCGIGYYFMAIMVALLMLGAMLLLHPLGNHLQKKSIKTTHKLRVGLKDRSFISQIYNPELEHQAKIVSMKFISEDMMIVKIEKGVELDLNQLACEWMTLEGIVSVEQI